MVSSTKKCYALLISQQRGATPPQGHKALGVSLDRQIDVDLITRIKVQLALGGGVTIDNQNSEKISDKRCPAFDDGVAFRLLAIGLILTFSITLCCGCSEKRQPQTKDSRASAPRPRPKPKPKKKTMVPKVEAQKEPERPENIEEWKESDYYAAKQYRDQRLTQAILRLGQQSAGDASAVPLLVNLLKVDQGTEKTENETKDAARRVQRRSRLSAEQIAATIIALGNNGTAKSRAVFEEILSNQLKTDDDRAAVERTLEALIACPRPENEAILLRALAIPETYRPAEPKTQEDQQRKRHSRSKTTDADQLRSKTQDIIESMASHRFRVRLAEYLLKPQTPHEAIIRHRHIIEAGRPVNLAAQIVLYDSPALDGETKKDLEKYFLECATNALGYALDPPPGIKKRLRSRWARPYELDCKDLQSGDPEKLRDNWTDSNPKLPYMKASLLWNAKMANAVAKRLDRVDAATKTTMPITLATTLPVDLTRAKLLEVLAESWKAGPKNLKLSYKTTDPGFLVVLKMLPRKHPEVVQNNRTAKSRAALRGRATQQSRSATSEQEAQERWMKESEQLLRSLCKRFDRVADGNDPYIISKDEWQSPEEVQKFAKLPFELHKDSQVVATYNIDWARRLKGQLDGLLPDPLTVHYIKLKGRHRFDRVLAHYRRGVKKSNVLEKGREAWVDRLQAGSTPNRKRSIDVLIHRLGPAPDRPADTEELVIEILSVEVKSPAGQAQVLRNSPILDGSI